MGVQPPLCQVDFLEQVASRSKESFIYIVEHFLTFFAHALVWKQVPWQAQAKGSEEKGDEVSDAVSSIG